MEDGNWWTSFPWRTDMGDPMNWDRIADRVRLHRQSTPRPIALVEGPSDRRVVSGLMPSFGFDTFPAGNREMALDAAEELEELDVTNVVTVVDRDFDERVASLEARGLALIPYDNADLESMLWSTPALERLLAEIGSESKLSRVGGATGLREAIGHELAPLQRLRRANAIESLGLNFDAVSIARRINLRDLTLDVRSLCDAVASTREEVDKGRIYEIAHEGEEPACPTTGAPLVRGRDALAALGVALRRVAGSCRAQSVTVEILENSLRLSATAADISNTTWHARVSSSVLGSW